MRQEETFGRLFQSHRVNRGLTQGELAGRVGYPSARRHSMVSRIETGSDEAFANPSQVSRLLRALHDVHPFTLTEIHQLATTYLGLASLDARGERSHLAVAVGGIVFSSSRAPYNPRDAAVYAFDKVEQYHDPARKAQAHRDHLWQVSYADSDWAIATHEEPGTIRGMRDVPVPDGARVP